VIVRAPTDSGPGVHVAAAVVVSPAGPEVDGAVHPGGTVNVTREFAEKLLDGAVNVKTRLLGVDPATVEVGPTAMVPSPLAADDGATTTSDEENPEPSGEATLNAFFGYVPATGFVIGAIVKDASSSSSRQTLLLPR
jgi:hypothetical protein